MACRHVRRRPMLYDRQLPAASGQALVEAAVSARFARALVRVQGGGAARMPLSVAARVGIMLEGAANPHRWIWRVVIEHPAFGSHALLECRHGRAESMSRADRPARPSVGKLLALAARVAMRLEHVPEGDLVVRLRTGRKRRADHRRRDRAPNYACLRHNVLHRMNAAYWSSKAGPR